MLTFDIYKTSSSWSFCVCFFFMCPFVSPKDLEKQQVTGYWWTTSKRGSAANSASAPSAPSKKPNSLSRRIRKIIGPRTEPTSPRTRSVGQKKRRPRAGGVLFFTGGFSCCWCKSLSQKTTKVGWTAFGSTVQEFEQIANSSLVFCTILYTIL